MHAPADDVRAHLHDPPAGGLYAPVVVGRVAATATVSASTATTRAVVEEKEEPAMADVAGG